MITNYTTLVDALGDWVDRDDLATKAPTFIQFTEARLNRLLEDPEMEVVSTATATGSSTALPDDFGSMVSVSTGNGPLYATGPVEFATYDTAISGNPRHYAIIDGAIRFWPGNSSAIISMVYRRRIPALTAAAPTNWLLTLAPDVYFYGCLVQAFGWDNDDVRVAGWKDTFDEAIGELRMDADKRKWGAGPIAPRIGRA